LKKITNRNDFDAVMARGVYVSTEHFALHLRGELIASRIGAVVPKRWAKKAVTRNLIKRQIYAIAIENTNGFACTDVVVRLKKTFPRTEYISACSIALKRAIRQELQQLINRATKES